MSDMGFSDIKNNSGLRVILVEPQLSENVGAVARAMLNCGLTDLIIVNPRESLPNQRADAMSAGATSVLNNAKVFKYLEDAVADLNRVYATTARKREITMRSLNPRLAVQEIRNVSKDGEKVGVMFGPEASGLTNEHISLADTIITVPLNPEFSSLNLGQAVLIIAYEWFTSSLNVKESKNDDFSARPANKIELVDFFNRFETALDKSGFFRSNDMRPSMIKNLRAMLQRANLTEQEIRTLHGVVSSLSGSWKETNNQLTKKDIKKTNG
ncbi:MAG: rRNA methyltransferase [Alphaproteobacteria bacterium]|jgi:tRNA/rRNA methyltransferase|nr:rRNA methyltransferase [Alphaproteobacteria bacterium]PPR13643.1 MAG: tRNA (cytidine/uridine-2'-O-)-methyltransferase TrmJ [Alphaproteobacteria bacterium MarineAlpha12_Bin1]|tara:strand:- start:3391 stop:4197 length:807 start_codon:yes stop_codon:yes gene_type:complete